MTVNAIYADPPESRVMPDNTIAAALRQEREEIARMLHGEAAKHEYAASELRADDLIGDVDPFRDRDEAQAHDWDAALINRLADMVLARTPVVAEPEAPEIAF